MFRPGGFDMGEGQASKPIPTEITLRKGGRRLAVTFVPSVAFAAIALGALSLSSLPQPVAVGAGRRPPPRRRRLPDR
jgi:hypothetical protein